MIDRDSVIGALIALGALAAVAWAAAPDGTASWWVFALFVTALVAAGATIVLPHFGLWGGSLALLSVYAVLHFDATLDAPWRHGIVFTVGLTLYAEATHLQIRVADWNRAAGDRHRVAPGPILAAVAVWIAVAVVLAGGLVFAYYQLMRVLAPAVLADSVDVALAWPLTTLLAAGALVLWLVRSPWWASTSTDDESADHENVRKEEPEVTAAEALPGGA